MPFRCFPRQWANSANCQKRADPHPRNRSRCSLLAAASSSSASSSAIGEESVQGRLHLLVSGALPAAKARYRPDSPRCSRAALFVWTAHPLARLTPCLETPMTHVEVHACPLSGLDPLMFSEVGPALLRKASRSSTSSRSSTCSSLVDILLSATRLVLCSSVVCGRPDGSGAARSATANMDSALLLRLACALAMQNWARGQLWTLANVPTPSAVRYGVIRWHFGAHLRTVRALLCWFEIGRSVSETCRFVKYHVWDAAVCNTCVAWWVYQWHGSTVWYLMVGFCACLADAHLN